MSLEGAIKLLEDLLKPGSRVKIRDYDMSEIWQNIFQSSKSNEELIQVSSLLTQVYKINPKLREKKCPVVDIIINNFGSPSIDVEQRFDASIPIFQLLSFYDDENIYKAAINLIDVFSAYTNSLENLPLDVLLDYKPLAPVSSEALGRIIEDFNKMIGGGNESEMALVLTILYSNIIKELPQSLETIQKIVLSLLNSSNNIKIHIAFALLYESFESIDICILVNQSILDLLYHYIIKDNDEIALQSYDIIKLSLENHYFIDESNLDKIFYLRTQIQPRNMHCVYKLMNLFTVPDAKDNINTDLIQHLCEILHTVITNKQISKEEVGFAFLCQASAIDACEGAIQTLYKEELRTVKSLVERNFIHSFPGVSAFLCSIGTIVGLKGADRIVSFVPKIIESAKSKELSVSEKEIICKSLAIMVGSGRMHTLREMVTELAEYQVTDSNKEISIIGTEMIIQLNKMLGIDRIAELSASLIDIIETDKDKDVVIHTFKALTSLLKYYDFEPSSFENILDMITNNKLLCCSNIFDIEKPFSIFKFVEIFAMKYPQTCIKIAQKLAEWLMDAKDKHLKCIVRPLAVCCHYCLLERKQSEQIVPRLIELIDQLSVTFEKVHSSILHILWSIFHQSHDGIDIPELYKSVSDLVVLYDHPKKGKELKGLPYAAMIIIEIAVQCTKEVTVSDAVLVSMLSELPFPPELNLMDLAMNLVVDLMSDNFRLGTDRLPVFKLISKILMYNEQETLKYGYNESTLIKMHECLQIECKINGYVACNLTEQFKDTHTDTVTFDSLLNE